jgi:UDP-MurNAc hydroxylase
MFELQYLGHAAWLVNNDNFKALFDPWLSPEGAFFGQWQQFPKNHHLLTPELLEDLDFIYISHAHEDHYDEWLLQQIDKSVPIYTADFGDKTLFENLRALGFGNVTELLPHHTATVKGVNFQILKTEDGLDSDSCIVLNDGKSCVLNLNDCHIDFTALKDLKDNIDLLLVQTSSAIWWPCVYSYDTEEMKALGREKRKNNLLRAAKYAEYLGAKKSIPNAGPPFFNDDRLDMWNYNKRADWNPFVLNDDAVKYFQQREIPADLVIPGSTIVVEGSHVEVKTDPVEATALSLDADAAVDSFKAYLAEHAPAKPVATPEEIASVVPKFAKQLTKIKKVSKLYAKQIGGSVLFDFQECGKWLLDFANDPPLTPYEGEDVVYSFNFDPNSVALLFREKAIDFERYFLGCNFRCHREPDTYNHFLFAMLKHFDTKRFITSENIYIRNDRGLLEETFLCTHKSATYEVQKYCPHMLANLEEIGFINEDDHLVCPLHGWKFDLETGRSVDKNNACVKIRKV